MLDKKAKVILRELIRSNNASYLVILKSFYPHGSCTNPCVKARDLGANYEIWADIYKLHERYRRFRYYMSDIKPQWKDVETIPYADNSVEVIQENINGERRKIMTKAPSGDIC
ncbi:gp644 [Bacillus phage G]|uniref:Gp644 n=1 Tax=Bacillus phage G TaxID=2884420 RepID=G3MB24_9CAUD|nr:gp644 [Bacillus phage G]AEO93887.1 gp644 [Bacillus phage G]